MCTPQEAVGGRYLSKPTQRASTTATAELYGQTKGQSRRSGTVQEPIMEVVEEQVGPGWMVISRGSRLGRKSQGPTSSVHPLLCFDKGDSA